MAEERAGKGIDFFETINNEKACLQPSSALSPSEVPRQLSNPAKQPRGEAQSLTAAAQQARPSTAYAKSIAARG